MSQGEAKATSGSSDTEAHGYEPTENRGPLSEPRWSPPLTGVGGKSFMSSPWQGWDWPVAQCSLLWRARCLRCVPSSEPSPPKGLRIEDQDRQGAPCCFFGAHGTHRASVEVKWKNKNTAVTNLKCDISLILRPWNRRRGVIEYVT